MYRLKRVLFWMGIILLFLSPIRFAIGNATDYTSVPMFLIDLIFLPPLSQVLASALLCSAIEKNPKKPVKWRGIVLAGILSFVTASAAMIHSGRLADDRERAFQNLYEHDTKLVARREMFHGRVSVRLSPLT